MAGFNVRLGVALLLVRTVTFRLITRFLPAGLADERPPGALLPALPAVFAFLFRAMADVINKLSLNEGCLLEG